MLMNEEDTKKSADTGLGVHTLADKAEARLEATLVSANGVHKRERDALIFEIGRIILDTEDLDPQVRGAVIDELMRTERGRKILGRAIHAGVVPVPPEVLRPVDGEESHTGADLLNRS
jgi:hypothetical protein